MNLTIERHNRIGAFSVGQAVSLRRIGNLIGNPPAGCGNAAATSGKTPAPCRVTL